MATNVADLVATLRMDAGQFTRTSQQIAGQTQTLASRFGGLATAAKGIFGAVAVKQVLDFGTAMFKVGMESEAFGRKYRAVFGENTQELDAWVDAHHEGFGVATDEVQGYLAQIGNLLTGMGQSADEAGRQATKILELAGAWSAWSGGQISVQDASDKLVKGMMGQTRGLIDLGLKVTEQEVNARMAAQGLGELTGAEASRAQQQVMWTLIQEKSTTAIGAYDEAMGGAYGAAMTMSTAIDEMKDRVGELVVKLAPLIEKLAAVLGLLTDFATFNIPDVAAWVERNLMTPMPTPGNVFSFSGAMGDWRAQILEQEQAAAAAAAARARIQQYQRSAALRAAMGNQQSWAATERARLDARYVAAQGTDVTRMQFNGELIAPEAIGRAASQLGRVWDGLRTVPDGLAKAVAQSLSDPFKKGRRDAMLQLRGMEQDIGSFFQGLPEAMQMPPGFSIADLIANQQQQTDFENRMAGMMTTAGALGLDNLVAELGSLSPSEWQTLFDLGLTMADIINLGIAAGDVYVPVTGYYDYDTGTWVPGKAAGGPVSAMTPYLVGEQGPELMVPGTAGTVIPNSRLGGTTTYAPTVNVHVAGSVISERELARIVEDQMIRTSRRGGSSEVF